MIPPLPDPISDVYTNKNINAPAIINLLAEGDQVIHIKHLKTARETWTALENIHERSNLSSKLFLLRKLYSSKLSDAGSMNEHIGNIYQ